MKPPRKPRRPLPLLELLDPRRLLTSLPTTTTTLTLSAPITTSTQPLTLTASISSPDSSPPTAGTVAFLELLDFSREPYPNLNTADRANLVTFTDPQTNLTDSAILLATVPLSPDSTATLSLPSFPASSDLYTGQFLASFLGSSLPLSLPYNSPLINAAPGQILPAPAANSGTSYLLFPQNLPLSIHRSQISILPTLPSNTFAYDPDLNPTFSDSLGYSTYFLSPTPTPLLISDSIEISSSNYNRPTYYTTVTPVPAFTHIQDLNPDFQSSISTIAIPTTPQPTSLKLQSSGSSTFTNPPTFSVSIYDLTQSQRFGLSSPTLTSRGSTHSADAGLLIQTGGSSGAGGSINTGGGYHQTPFLPPGPFPTGTVSFFDENSILLATLPLDSTGTASFSPDPRSFSLGDHQLHISYSGDSNFLPAALDSDPFTITHTTTYTSLISSAGPFYANSTLALESTVSLYDDLIDPTGTVSFFDENNSLLASVPLGSTSSIHLNLPTGVHTLTASYSGDSDCLPSASSPLTLTILDNPNSPPPFQVIPTPTYGPEHITLLSLTLPPTPVNYIGSFPVTLTALVTGYQFPYSTYFDFSADNNSSTVGSVDFSPTDDPNYSPSDTPFLLHISTSFNFNGLPPGAHPLHPITDSNSSSFYSNFTSDIDPSFTPPTLQTTSSTSLLILSQPTTSYIDGQSVLLTFTVTNAGPQTSLPTPLSLSITDGHIHSISDPGTVEPLDSYTIDPLDPGQSTTLSITRLLPTNANWWSNAISLQLPSDSPSYFENFSQSSSVSLPSPDFTIINPIGTWPPIYSPPIIIDWPIILNPDPIILAPTPLSPSDSPISLTHPSTLTAGSSLLLTVTSNTNSPLDIYLSPTNSSSDSSAIFLGSFTFPSDVYSGSAYQSSLCIPASTPAATYHLIAVYNNQSPTDFFSTNSETNFGLLTLLTPSLSATLTPKSPSTLHTGSLATFNLSLSSLSHLTSSKKYTVSYYFSSDTTFSPDDTLFSKQSITLSPHPKKSLPLTARIPYAAPLGTAYLIAVVNPAAKSPSSHLEVSSRPLTIAGPHLSASILSVKSTPNPNFSSVTLRLTSDGSSPFSSPVTLTLLADFPTPNTPLKTLKKYISLKPHQHLDLTLTLPRTPLTHFSATIS